MKEALGDEVGLALDCGPGLTVPDALKLAKAVEPLNVMWLEDMITGDYVPYVLADLYRDVTQSTSTPIHTGEQIYLRQNFKDLIEKRAVDVIGPDPCDIGGIAELKWVAEYADLHGILMAPHGVLDGPSVLLRSFRCRRPCPRIISPSSIRPETPRGGTISSKGCQILSSRMDSSRFGTRPAWVSNSTRKRQDSISRRATKTFSIIRGTDMAKIRLGVIGAGGIVCRLHLPALVDGEDFEVVVLGGRREHRLKHQCEQFNIPRWTQDYDSIIADNSLDAILVAHRTRSMCLGESKHWIQEACPDAETVMR